MRYLNCLMRIQVLVPLLVAVVMGFQTAPLKAQTLANRPAIATSRTPPNRQTPQLIVPNTLSTSDRHRSISQGVSTPREFVDSNAQPEIPVPSGGYWIVSARTVLPDTLITSVDVRWYPNTPDGSWCRYAPETFVDLISRNSAPICIIAHGAGYSIQDVRKEAPEFSRRLWRLEPQSNLPSSCRGINLIFFSWPSAVAPVPAEILTGQQSARQGRFVLAPLLERLSETKDRRICLIGHSYGGRVVLSALHWTALREAKDSYRRNVVANKQSRYRVVLLAAAVNHDKLNQQEFSEFDERYDMALPRVERLLNVFNQRDCPLTLYSICNPHPLGRTSFFGEDYLQFDPQDSRKIQELDVTSLLGMRHAARFYSGPEIRAAIQPYVFFCDQPTGADAPTTSSSVRH